MKSQQCYNRLKNRVRPPLPAPSQQEAAPDFDLALATPHDTPAVIGGSGATAQVGRPTWCSYEAAMPLSSSQKVTEVDIPAMNAMAPYIPNLPMNTSRHKYHKRGTMNEWNNKQTSELFRTRKCI